MTQSKIYKMAFSKLYSLYVAKAEKKSRTQAQVDEIIKWLTGYSQTELENFLNSDASVERFFNESIHFNPLSQLITGTVCGVKVEDIEDPLMQKIRYLDKLVDELAKGKDLSDILRKSDTVNRCPWAREGELNHVYHDTEWGLPEHNDQKLFEMLCLEGAQAGLSWITVLKKRAHYLTLFDNFDPHIVAHYTDDYLDQCLKDPGIIRHRGKVYSIRSNALAFHEIVKEWGSFDAFIWSFVEGNPIINHFETQDEVPVSTAISDAMSKALKKKGFKFCGTTICYAYMQAIGMVNDHLVSCDRYLEVQTQK